MEWIKKYTDLYGDEIPEGKAKQSGEYFIEYTNEGTLEKIETYKNHLLSKIEYLVDSSTNWNDLITELSQDHEKVLITRTNQVSGAYILYETRYFENGVLTRKGFEVEKDDVTIAEQVIDVTSDEILQVIKTSYTNGRSKYEFSYDSSGNVILIMDLQDSSGTKSYSASNPFVTNFNFVGKNLTYYQDDTLMPKTSP